MRILVLDLLCLIHFLIIMTFRSICWISFTFSNFLNRISLCMYASTIHLFIDNLINWISANFNSIAKHMGIQYLYDIMISFSLQRCTIKILLDSKVDVFLRTLHTVFYIAVLIDISINSIQGFSSLSTLVSKFCFFFIFYWY